MVYRCPKRDVIIPGWNDQSDYLHALRHFGCRECKRLLMKECSGAQYVGGE